MLETLQQIGKATPFLWWREPKNVDLGAITALLAVALGLILTARLRIDYSSVNNGALAAFLPSALGVAFIACTITSLCLRVFPFANLGRFIPLSARCFRLFTLLMLLVSVPFLLREIGILPTDFAIGRPEFIEGKISRDYQWSLSILYAGCGIATFWTVVLYRHYRKLSLIRKSHPSMIKNSPRFLFEPILTGGLVSYAALLTTHVTLWADLPAWLAVIKVS